MNKKHIILFSLLTTFSCFAYDLSELKSITLEAKTCTVIVTKINATLQCGSVNPQTVETFEGSDRGRPKGTQAAIIHTKVKAKMEIEGFYGEFCSFRPQYLDKNRRDTILCIYTK